MVRHGHLRLVFARVHRYIDHPNYPVLLHLYEGRTMGIQEINRNRNCFGARFNLPDHCLVHANPNQGVCC